MTSGERGVGQSPAFKSSREVPLTNHVPFVDGLSIRQRRPDQNGAQAPERPRALIDVGEDLGSVPRLCERCERPGSRVDAAQSDTEHGDADGDVNEVVEASDSRVVERDDERRCSST